MDDKDANESYSTNAYRSIAYFSALDIDECLFDVARCSADADCVNTAGSYSCKCHSGFTGDGFSCRKGLLSL